MKTKRISTVIFALLCCISSVYCDTKTIDVQLDKQYSNGIFNIVYNSSIECSGYVISPSGKEYECNRQESGYMYCEIDAITTGIWQVNLSSEEEIGQVTVSISVNSEKTNNKNNDIAIVRKITGLNAYLEDDYIKAEWTDTKCGDVLVIVSDAATKETINSNIVSSNYYEYKIPEKYESIFVTLVPTSLASRDEAKTSYTFSLKDVPKIKVEHSIGQYTNKDEVTVQVSASEECVYESYINGKRVENMSFDTEIGLNKIKIIAINQKGHRTVYEYEFEKDTEAPILTLDNDWSGFSTYEDFVTVSGFVKDASKLVVNNESVSFNENGKFSKNITLQKGNNEVKITAIDEAGNESLFIMNIERKTKSNGNLIKDVGFIIVVIFTIFLVVFKTGNKKNKGKKDTTENVENKESEENKKNNKTPLKKESARKQTIKEEKIKPDKTKKEKKTNIKNDKVDSGKENKIYSKSTNSMFEASVWILIIVLIIIITNFIMRIDIVQSSSMEPNIVTGEMVFTNKLTDIDEIKIGDIIVFKKNGKKLCKRVIGTAGDVITFSNGYVVINGEYCQESYLAEDIETNSLKTFVVPNDSFFCLGDNRENSVDSRYWDDPYLHKREIEGKVMFHIPFLNIFDK